MINLFFSVLTILGCERTNAKKEEEIRKEILLLLLSSGIRKGQRNSYIIVHTFKPEGVEIDSIIPDSVEIYDRNTLMRDAKQEV